MDRSGIKPNGVFLSSVMHGLIERGRVSIAQAVRHTHARACHRCHRLISAASCRHIPSLPLSTGNPRPPPHATPPCSSYGRVTTCHTRHSHLSPPPSHRIFSTQVLTRMERYAGRLQLELGEYHVLLRAICRKGHLAMAEGTKTPRGDACVSQEA